MGCGGDRSLSSAGRDHLLERAKRCADLLQKCRAGWSVAQSQLIRGGIAAASSEPERACIIWQEAERELERNEMLLLAAAVRFWRGRLRRDTSLETSAELAFRAQGVTSPERMAAALAPGVPFSTVIAIVVFPDTARIVGRLFLTRAGRPRPAA